MRAAIFALCLLFTVAEALARPADPEGLRAEMEALFEDAGIVGAAYAVVEEGEITVAEGLGLADLATGEPVTAQTVFRIGSVSKNVTSLLAVSLASEGIIDLDAPVRTLVPDLPFAPHPDGPVKLVHLLEHTAGLPGSTYAEYAHDGAPLSPQGYADLVGDDLDLRWAPGRYYSYANAGHTLAALALEQASGSSFDELVRGRIFKPLGMTGASFDWLQSRPISYNADRSEARFWELGPRPSGALQASVSDMAKLVRFYATEGEVAPSIASRALLERMRGGETNLAAEAGYDLTYGLGTFGFVAAERIFYGHWGRIDGFQANLGYLPDSGGGFVLLANIADRQGMAALRETLAAYVARGLPSPSLPQPVEDDVLAYEGWYAPFTHDMEMRSWIFGLLGLSQVEATGTGLLLSPAFPLGRRAELRPLGGGLFAEEGVPVATHVFATTPDGRMTMLGDGQETFMRLLPADAWARLVWSHALGIAVAGSLLLLVPVLLLRATGVLRAGPASRALMLSAASSVLLVLLFAGFVRYGLGGLDLAAKLGKPTLPSLGLLASSLLWPVFAGLAVWQAGRSVADGRRMAGLLAALPAGILLVTAFVLTAAGWLPLRTWT
jgi:CubicO group peptidase (beta-lactamase class C family)